MVRKFVLMSVLAVGLGSTVGTVIAQVPAAATQESAASFIGEWTMSAEGANGPVQIALSIKTDGGKVTGAITMGPASKDITDILVSGKSLVLKYDTDYQGSPIPTVVKLTPSGEKVAVEIDFQSGAYTMSGTATKK